MTTYDPNDPSTVTGYNITVDRSNDDKKQFILEWTRFKVLPTLFDFQATELHLFDAPTGAYTNNITNGEEMDVNIFPKIKPYFFDKAGNRFSDGEIPKEMMEIFTSNGRRVERANIRLVLY